MQLSLTVISDIPEVLAVCWVCPLSTDVAQTFRSSRAGSEVLEINTTFIEVSTHGFPWEFCTCVL